MKICLVIGILILWLVTRYTKDQGELMTESVGVSFTETQSVWIDSVLANLTLEEKVGQMFMYVVHEETWTDSVGPGLWTSKNQLGGIAFEYLDPSSQYELTRHYQSLSELPLLIGMFNDEHNPARFHIPDHWELSAVNNNLLIEQLGTQLSEYVDQLGAHIYFSPSDPYTRQTVKPLISVGQQMLNRNLLPCASYGLHSIPVAQKASVVDSTLAPYHHLVRSGVSGMVVPSKIVRSKTQEQLGTQFDYAIKNFFQTRVGFQGLMIGRINPDMDQTLEVSELARAGTDLMLIEERPTEAINIILNLVKGNLMEESIIDQRVRKILQAKYWSSAKDWHEANKEGRLLDPGFPVAETFNREITKSSITLVRDEETLVPFKELDAKRIMVLTIDDEFEPFRKSLANYAPFHHSHLAIDPEDGLEDLDDIRIGLYNTVIVALPEMKVDSFAVDRVLRPLFLKEGLDLVLVNFASPKQLRSLDNFPTIVQAYNQRQSTQDLTAQLIFGGIGARGRLPLTIKRKFAEREGISTEPSRLAYALPAEAGLHSNVLEGINEIVEEGIAEQAMPGCQILVARKGKVVYHKAFGHHTYDQKIPVRTNDLYDIASITKVAATTLASMKLVNDRKMYISDPLGMYFKDTKLNVDTTEQSILRYVVDTVRYEDYNAAQYANVTASELRGQYPSLKDTVRYQDSLLLVYNPRHLVISHLYNIFNIRLEDLLTHHSGIPLEMPLYPYVHSRRTYHRKYAGIYDSIPRSEYGTQVAEKLFLGDRHRDSLWKAFKYSKLHTNNSYHYSDMNMILLQAAIDSLTQSSMDSYLEETFYKPLGLQTMRFNPRKSIISRRLVPTEIDQHWRRQLLKGYVHDPAAALLGGVGGNAGLFSNANDLAILFQMLLNGGEYGENEYIEKEIIDGFTRRKKGHRGLGFDKPPKRGRYIIAPDASSKSYGHTGFTGTCVWVDPEEELVFVFLSNRIYPTAENWKINQLRIRSRIHQVVYDAIYDPGEQLEMNEFEMKELIGGNF